MLTPSPMPFFDRYDISVEFDRHTAAIVEGLRRRWSEVADWSDDKIAHTFGTTEICPIEIVDSARTIHQGRLVSLHGKGYLYEYVSYTYYRGDDELWHLFPEPRRSDLTPEGEVFRGHLILQTLAKDEREAEGNFSPMVIKLQEVLRRQEKRIAAYYSTLPSLIMDELKKLRENPPSHLIQEGNAFGW